MSSTLSLELAKSLSSSLGHILGNSMNRCRSQRSLAGEVIEEILNISHDLLYCLICLWFLFGHGQETIGNENFDITKCKCDSTKVTTVMHEGIWNVTAGMNISFS
jgi:hypothetical protein